MSRAATGRAVRMLDRVLSANGVTRVRDLPEEARVRLYRQLSSFFESERTVQWERRVNGNVLSRARLWLCDVGEGIRQALQS